MTAQVMCKRSVTMPSRAHAVLHPIRRREAVRRRRFGLNSIDLVTVVAEFPASNTKQRLQRFARLPGGQIATATATCARLGWRARYIGSFGDDELGHAVAAESDERRRRHQRGANGSGRHEPVCRRPCRRAIGRAHGALGSPSRLAMGPGRRAEIGGHLRAHADRRLSRNGGGDSGGAVRARRRRSRRSSTSRRCGPASAICCRTSTRSSPPQEFPSALTGLRGSGPSARGDRRASSAPRWSASRSAKRAAWPGATAAKSARRLSGRLRRQHRRRRRLSRRLCRRLPGSIRAAISKTCWRTPMPSRR